MNFSNVRNFIRHLTFKTASKPAPVIEMDNPKNAEETRLLGRAQELLDSVHLTADKMKQMDNANSDLNPSTDSVAINGENLSSKNANWSGVASFHPETGELQELDVQNVKRVSIELHKERNYDRILLSKATVEKDGPLLRYHISDEVDQVLNRDYSILLNTQDKTLVFEQSKTDHVWVGQELTYGLS